MNALRWRSLASAAFTSLLIATMVVVAIMIGAVGAQSSDPAIGTWKLNPAKSKYSPGPAPKSATVTYAAAGQGLKVVVDTIGMDGVKGHWEYTASFDGKDYPLTGNNADADSASLKRISANSVEVVNKRGGKRTLTHTRVLSSDGKTLTITTTGTNAQGQTVKNVQVFERG